MRALKLKFFIRLLTFLFVTKALAGQSATGSACSRYVGEQSAKVGIIEDHGVFDGVRSAVTNIAFM